MTYEIKISGTPKTWNAFINKSHWAYVQYKNAIRKQVAYAWHQLSVQGHRPLQQVRVVYLLGYPTRRRSDIDSVCTKPHLDALVQLGVIADDNREIVREVRTTWEASKTPYTKIIIEEITL